MVLVVSFLCYITILQNMGGERGCVLHADNYAGQNKNHSLVGYLAWRCMTGFHEEIQLSFMVVGHTRCLVNGCFGLIKQKYR